MGWHLSDVSTHESSNTFSKNNPEKQIKKKLLVPVKLIGLSGVQNIKGVIVSITKVLIVIGHPCTYRICMYRKIGMRSYGPITAIQLQLFVIR